MRIDFDIRLTKDIIKLIYGNYNTRLNLNQSVMQFIKLYKNNSNLLSTTFDLYIAENNLSIIQQFENMVSLLKYNKITTKNDNLSLLLYFIKQNY